MNYYETDRALAEYLLFHYGTPEAVLPFDPGPRAALEFPARCVSECLERDRLRPGARALDLGCAVGRATFELARHCARVVGIDWSARLIDAAQRLRRVGTLDFAYADEGDLTLEATARVPVTIDRRRVAFEHGDALNLRGDLGAFDVVLAANLIDRLEDPRRFLARVPALVAPGGQLILTSPYTWLPQYTPREHWLGGFERDGRRVKTLDTLKEILAPNFQLAACRDLPFLIREHARKFQWSVAEASVWNRR
ncbi:MAG: putative 4-mercaptohistidine N1-methyltransferase [Verrucomicrobia bacterium]|nr:putative 4-mercaptohistidine N1-methyltransferase [Verrucomicrobiota bacterium]